jgi:hypothetical protein
MNRRSNRLTGRTRKVILGVASLALAGGAFALSAGQSNAQASNAGNAVLAGCSFPPRPACT